MTTEQEIIRWVVSSLKMENIKNPKITITGNSGKGDNYGGEITFVTATGKSDSDQDTKFDIVIKTGRRSETLRQQVDMKLMYEREVYLYNRVFPVFREYQLSKGSEYIFSAVPKCYKTLVEKDVEILVLENLKSKSYELHDRQVPMNTNHMKLVICNYAKFHATSFVMRDQNPEQFNELTSNMKPLLSIFLKGKVKKMYDEMYHQAISYTKQIDSSLSSKMDKLIGKSFADALLDLQETTLEDAVIVHGDCWNNNYMFRYEESNRESPKELAIIDWQAACLHSPVFDLSYFLYVTSSRENMDKIEELLQYYHKNLSFFISEMGSDPEKLYTYPRLLKHWEKYSVYGIAPVMVFLKLMLCNENDAPSMDDIDNFVNAISTIKSKNENEFNSRLYGAIHHFCTWNRN